MYYCKTRYYVPEWCRWLNTDSPLFLDFNNIQSTNLFSYCGNDPVNNVDPNGDFAFSALIIGAIIGFSTSYLSDVIASFKDGFQWSDFNTFKDNWIKYIGATLDGAIGGLGAGLCSTILANGIGNVVEASFAGEISSFGDVMLQFTLGGVISGVGYGVSKFITGIFADKRIFKILGDLTDNTKVNKRLAKAGFGNLKIGKNGIKGVYNKMYQQFGFESLKKVISYGYDIIVGFVF